MRESKVLKELKERTDKEIALKYKQITRLKEEIRELESHATQVELQALYGFSIGDSVTFNQMPYIVGEAFGEMVKLYRVRKDGTKSKRYNHLHITEFGRLKRSQP